MPEAFPEIVIRSFADLADALLAVKNHLQISNACLENLAGACPGFVDKYLGRSRSKQIGPTSFDLLIGALGIRLRVEVDPDQARRVASRHERRRTEQIRSSQPLSAALLARAAAELGRRGAIAAAKARRREQRRNSHA
jgi:hypothetical protein